MKFLIEHIATHHPLDVAETLAELLSKQQDEDTVPWFTVGQPIECAACHEIVKEGHSYCLDNGKFYCYDCHD